jgi:hypothetical protein
MITEDVPAGLPPASQGKQSSIKSADVYGSYQTGVPTTIVGGSAGVARVEGAAAQLDAETPVKVQGLSPELLRRPAGVLLVLVAIAAVLSWLDR